MADFNYNELNQLLDQLGQNWRNSKSALEASILRLHEVVRQGIQEMEVLPPDRFDEKVIFFSRLLRSEIMQILLLLSDELLAHQIGRQAARLFDLIGSHVLDLVSNNVTPRNLSRLLKTNNNNEQIPDIIDAIVGAIFQVNFEFARNAIENKQAIHAFAPIADNSIDIFGGRRPSLHDAMADIPEGTPTKDEAAVFRNKVFSIRRYYSAVIRETVVLNRPFQDSLIRLLSTRGVNSTVRHQILRLLCPKTEDEACVLQKDDYLTALIVCLHEPELKRDSTIVLCEFVIHGTQHNILKLIQHGVINSVLLNSHVLRTNTETDDKTISDTASIREYVEWIQHLPDRRLQIQICNIPQWLQQGIDWKGLFANYGTQALKVAIFSLLYNPRK